MWNITTNSLLIMISLSYDANEKPTTRPVRQTDAQSFKHPQIFTNVETTVEPTATPTAEPMAKPTVEPIVEPTVKPTVEPTVTPTAEHIAKSAVEPTVKPTVEPTVKPTAEPIATSTLKPRVRATSPVKYAVVMSYENESRGMTYSVKECSAEPKYIHRTCGDLIEQCGTESTANLFGWRNMIPYRINDNRTVTELGHWDSCTDLFYGVPIHFADSGKIGMKVDVTIYARGEKRRSVQIDYTATSTPENIFRSEFPDRTDQRRVCAYAIQKDAGWDHFDQKKLYNLSHRSFRQLNIVEVRDNEKCHSIEL